MISLFKKNTPTKETIKTQRQYMGILETYNVDWPLDKTARDIWQNYFDGKGQTLDGVQALIGDVGDGQYSVAIQSEETYDYRLLLHLGGTTKTENVFSAGGVGEGSKVAALVLLRDYNCSKVAYASKDWVLEFSLDAMPPGEYVKPIRGLYATVRQNENYVDGNGVYIVTENQESALTFLQAKNLFYHSQNKDFQNPLLNIPQVGGFQFVGKEKKGNFYLAGQRRHLEKEEWNTSENISLWTATNNGIRMDRDRGIVTQDQINEKILPPLFAAASSDELEHALRGIEPIWSYSRGMGKAVLEEIINQLNQRDVKLEFDEQYLASTVFSFDLHEVFKAQGYILCNYNFSLIGMKSTAKKLQELLDHTRLTPTEKQETQLEVLRETATAYGKSNKDISLYSQSDENSFIKGNHTDNEIWLSTELFNCSYPKATAIYLHELDHEHGSDNSASFSYALTDTLEEVIAQMLEQPTTFQNLQKRWESG